MGFVSIVMLDDSRGKVLIVSPVFHHYEEGIAQAISRLGFDVERFFYCEKEAFTKNIILKIQEWAIRSKRLSFFHGFFSFIFFPCFNLRLLFFTLFKSYSYVFVVKGFGISPIVLSIISARRKILYQWDTVERFPSVVKIYHIFDRVFTYSEADAESGFGEFLPNFAVAANDNFSKNLVLFVGEYTDFRFVELEKLGQWCLRNRYDFKFTLIGVVDSVHDSLIEIQCDFVDQKDYRRLFAMARYIVDLSRGGDKNKTQRYYDAVISKKVILGDTGGIPIDNILSVDALDFETMCQNFLKTIHYEGIPRNVDDWVAQIFR